ncbi:sterol desaturase family protein [Parasphingorhabdus sp.]|uniref:sterol desaturase family protein n=3 Tax=Parasphingorhabdus sp. TaxID=2709688 RepID=UPI003266B11F
MNPFKFFSRFTISEAHRIWVVPLAYLAIALGTYMFTSADMSAWTVRGSVETFDDLGNTQEWGDFATLALTIFGASVMIRLAVTLFDFYRVNRNPGTRISSDYLLWVLACYVLGALMFIFMTLVIGWIAYAGFGFDADSVTAFISSGDASIKAFHHAIPNLINLPGFIAFILIYLVWSLLMYGIHYLGHVSRLYWLLAHRNHHITTILTSGSTLPADFSFPLNWLYVIVQGLILVTVSKLITENSTLIYFLCFAIFYFSLEQFNHTQSFYLPIKNSRVFRFFCRLFVCGPYHILHHSSKPEHQMVNLGGNSAIWDHAFGTFCELPGEDKDPSIGLTHQPTIYLSSFNVIFSGLMQIGYELWHNKDFGTRMKILFGHIEYEPPVSRNFLVDYAARKGVEQHKISPVHQTSG